MSKHLFDVNSDYFLVQGDTHRMTEDYVLTNDREVIFRDSDPDRKKPLPGKIIGDPFAIVSDGCSGSEHTDVGARLLGLAAKQTLYTSVTPHSFCESVLRSSHAVSRVLQLPINCLDATLLAIRTNTQKTHYEPIMVGDGFFAGKNCDKSIFFYQYTFAKNAPFYVRYTFDPENLKGYFEKFGTRYSVRYVRMIPNPQVQCGFQIVSESNTDFDLPTDLENGAPFWFTPPMKDMFSVANLEAAAVISDGAESFISQIQGQVSKMVDPEHIVWEVMNFKRYGGTFVANRCSKAFDLFRKRNWVNQDDFGMTAIHIKGEDQ